MPLLPKEKDFAPDDLFSLAPDAFVWQVAHVRSRQEKLLARYFDERSVPFYLPQVSRVLRPRPDARARVSHVPLFQGYVFFRGDAAARTLAVRSGVVASVIEVPDQELLGAQLQQIRQLQQAGATFEPYDELVAGDPVRVRSGPFAGYTGVVLRQARGERLIIELSLLRKRAAVEFDAAVLKRAAAR